MDDAGLSAGLVVRRARPDELAACAELYVRVLRETFTWIPPERHRAADFLQAAREEEVFVAVQAGRIVGVVTLLAAQNFMHSLYVTERGRGIGKALLDHAQATLAGPIQLKCQTANRRAQAFYRREGFHCIGRGSDNGVAWLRLVRD